MSAAINPELLLSHFDRISDAPDAIPLLRRFILDLAVRGKLVPVQRESEADLAWSAFCKEFNDRNYDPALQTPFTVPRHWRWSVMKVIADCRAAAKISSSAISKEDWLLDLEDIDGGTGRIMAFAKFGDRQSLSTKAAFDIGDVLYGKLRPYLNKVVVADRPGFCTTEIIPIRPRPFLVPGYLRVFLRSPHFLRYSEKRSYGMKMPRLGTKDLEGAAVPTPPPGEQHRIVAKVDELMTFCDRLEMAQAERESRRDRLVSASLHRLNQPNSADGQEALREDARFYLNHLPRLTTRHEHINQLRQTLLNLAVRGRLVAQNSNDEPASELLKQIQAEKARLLKEGKINKHEPLPTINDDDVPYSVPQGWQWKRFIEVAAIQSNLVNPKDYQDSPHIAPDNIESGTGRLLPYNTIGASAVFSSKHLFFPGCILYSKIRPALAKAVIVDFGGLCSADMYPILPFVSREYLHKYMLSEVFVQQSVNEDNRVAMPKINQTSLSKILVAVPPLAEQHRIVAKVDELMALCDRLEAQLTTTETESRRLLEAVLHGALTETLQPA